MLSSSSTIRTFFDAMGVSCEGAAKSTRTPAGGQHQTECRAAQLSGHRHDVAAGKERALARNGKSQAHAVLLERNRGLEQSPARLLAQARSGIVNLHRHAAAGCPRH